MTIAATHRDAKDLSSLIGARTLIGLLGARWVAGILENFGIPMLSEIVALGILAVLGASFLVTPLVARAPITVLIGFATLTIAAFFSIAANPKIETTEAASFCLLMTLYLSFANELWLRIKFHHLILVERFLMGFLIIGALLSVSQILTGTAFTSADRLDVPRAIGSDVHPVSFGLQVVIALVGLIVVRRISGRPINLFVLLVLVAAALALYLTYARTAWAMALVVTFVALMHLRSRSIRLAIIALGALATWSIISNNVRFADLQSFPLFLSQLDLNNVIFDHRYVDNSLSWRVVNWFYGAQQAMSQPIFGHGPGQSAHSSEFSLEMHNLALELFFELGVWGLVGFSILIFGLFRLHSRSYVAECARPWMRGLGLAMLLATLVSTSFVDQLMGVLLYFVVLRVSHLGAPPTSNVNL